MRYPVEVAVEGTGDEPIARRLLEDANREIRAVRVLRGKDTLDKNLAGYNSAARYGPWFVLRDLDRDAPCPGALVRRLLPTPATWMRFRLAVHSAEAWLMADREKLSSFLQVPRNKIPQQVESLDDPKQTLVNLARKSRSAAIRADMVPAHGTSARVGPAYVSRIIEFSQSHWRPKVAAEICQSLSRCRKALKSLG